MKDKSINKWCIFALLLALLIARFFLTNEQSKWIQFVSYFGVVIALGDLYSKTYKKNHEKDKFNVIKGAAILVAILLMIIAAGMIINVIVLNSKGNDILTILALLISLPNELYCEWITSYVDK